MEHYKVEGNKVAARKFIYFWLFSAAWYFLQMPFHSLVTGCSGNYSACTTGQLNTILRLQSFDYLPITLFCAYLGYYSVKVIIQKRIPPSGNGFPFTIPKVIERDHYIFGVTGIILAIVVLFLFVRNIYYAFKITSI